MIVGSRAIGVREPCQVLTEAALSGAAGVPREFLKGAACRNTACERAVEKRVRGIIFWGLSPEAISVPTGRFLIFDNDQRRFIIWLRF